jgi:hypothetical protein
VETSPETSGIRVGNEGDRVRDLVVSVVKNGHETSKLLIR